LSFFCRISTHNPLCPPLANAIIHPTRPLISVRKRSIFAEVKAYGIFKIEKYDRSDEIYLLA
jgi:hypothetical protein